MEREPLETEISASVKSEESSESAKEIRAVSPTMREEELAEIAMVGGVVSPVSFVFNKDLSINANGSEYPNTFFPAISPFLTSPKRSNPATCGAAIEVPSKNAKFPPL